jgi:hypothetical protein
MSAPRRTFQSGLHSQTTLDVQFPERLTPEALAVIIGDLVKSLVFQRKQIPQQYDMVKRDAAVEKGDEAEDVVATESTNPRAAARAQRLLIRRRTLRKRYVARARDFLRSFDQSVDRLQAEIARDRDQAISCVSFIFGATPVTPKEVYHVYPPTNQGLAPATDDIYLSEKARKRAAIQLFRTMITNDSLFEQIGRPMNLTNMFVAVKRRPNIANGWLVPRPEFGNLNRGKVTEFRMRYVPRIGQSQVVTVQQTPMACTPIPMDMCTPGDPKRARNMTPVRLWGRKSVSEEEEEDQSKMVETPCVKRTLLYQRNAAESMDIDSDNKVDSAEEQDSEGQEWYVSVEPIKGFKDPQILLAKS